MAIYNKAIVAFVMAIIYYINAKYGIQLPIGEAEANLLVGLVISYLVWRIPNKKADKDVKSNT